MAQLYFKFGAMGSSKTANALMARFNYEERGHLRRGLWEGHLHGPAAGDL